MISRRGLFGFLAAAPVAGLAQGGVSKAYAHEAYVPLPSGERISIDMNGHMIRVSGSADERTAALIDAKLAEANEKMMAELRRNMGSIQAKWSQRNGL